MYEEDKVFYPAYITYPLIPGYKLEIEDIESPGCNNGNYPEYRVVDAAGNIVKSGLTCRCGRGCSNTDTCRDDWGHHDTCVEDYRADVPDLLAHRPENERSTPMKKYYFTLTASGWQTGSGWSYTETLNSGITELTDADLENLDIEAFGVAVDESAADDTYGDTMFTLAIYPADVDTDYLDKATPVAMEKSWASEIAKARMESN